MPEDMPDRMPEDLPDRMPEDMSDRMPEDLPLRKCINFMLGITRSKVFCSLTKIPARCPVFFWASTGSTEDANSGWRPCIH